MATNGLVTPVVDGPGVHNRFGRADDVFDRPECLVHVSDRFGIVEGIGAQNPEPVVARFGFDLLFINREMMIPLNFQIATVAFVSDQTFIPLTKLLL
jgi:hypothetical protein